MKNSLQEKYDCLEECFEMLKSDYNNLREEKQCFEKHILQLEALCLANGLNIPYKNTADIPF